MTPSAWLLEQLDLLYAQPRGRALDVACGRGRNTLFLAGLGFEVDAVDIDAEAIAAVRSSAAELAVSVEGIVADVTATAFRRPPYQVIINTNFLERSIFPRLVEALAPGGLLVFETFTRDHLDVLGRAMNPAYLLEREELARAFSDLEIVRAREAILDEERPRAVASLVARRPLA